jgi:cobyrinic acid a,c-diamide synthase
MCGVLQARGAMAGRLTLGYREAVAATATSWLEKGTELRGHEFHYSTVEAEGELQPAWRLRARGAERHEGMVSGSVQASYLHVHWAAHTDIPRRFVAAAQVASVPA